MSAVIVQIIKLVTLPALISGTLGTMLALWIVTEIVGRLGGPFPHPSIYKMTIKDQLYLFGLSLLMGSVMATAHTLIMVSMLPR